MFANVLKVLVVVAALVSAYVNWMQWQDNLNLKADISKLRTDLDSVQIMLEDSDETVRAQRARLRRSLDSFTKHYRTRVRATVDTVAAYEGFDTPDNRADYKGGFRAEETRRLEAVRSDLRALVALVKEWRLVFRAFRETVNGQIDDLQRDIDRNDVSAMLGQFAVIERNLDSKIDLLDSALARAAQSCRL